MASNKNQHFVPKCYLRAFAVEGVEAAINLYNIDRRRFIECAPLKNQCSGDYFYGKDPDLEKALQTVEGAYGSAQHEILQPGYILSDEHRELLKIFWLLQHLRTEAASRRAVEMAAATEAVIGTDAPLFRLEIKTAVQLAMMAFSSAHDILRDLKGCLLRNTTSRPFVTCDDPAVLTNRWYLESPSTKGCSFGVNSGGTIVLLPVSPQILFLGYDADVYSVPNNKGWVNVTREQDVKALNEHQFLNCRANIFVKNPNDARFVHDSFLTIAPLRPKSRHVINYAVLDRQEGGYTRYKVVDRAGSEDDREAKIHMQALTPAPTSWPSQLTWRRKGFVFYNGTGVGWVRRSATTTRGDRPFRKILVNRG
jgi:hypothetical protein